MKKIQATFTIKDEVHERVLKSTLFALGYDELKEIKTDEKKD